MLSELAFGKKIIARFTDGSAKMNLGIASAVALLQEATGKLPVTVAEDVPEAMDLLTNVAASAGRVIAGDLPADIFLVPAVVEPVATVPAVSTEPKPRRHRGDGKAPTKVVRKYATLSSTFMNGSFLGQIASVYKTRETDPQKVSDFKAALAAGDCNWDKLPLPKAIKAKLEALGIGLPEAGV